MGGGGVLERKEIRLGTGVCSAREECPRNWPEPEKQQINLSEPQSSHM